MGPCFRRGSELCYNGVRSAGKLGDLVSRLCNVMGPLGLLGGEGLHFGPEYRGLNSSQHHSEETLNYISIYIYMILWLHQESGARILGIIQAPAVVSIVGCFTVAPRSYCSREAGCSAWRWTDCACTDLPPKAEGIVRST